MSEPEVRVESLTKPVKKYLFREDYIDRFNKLNTNKHCRHANIQPTMKLEEIDLIYNDIMDELRVRVTILKEEIETRYKDLGEILTELASDRAIKMYRGIEVEPECRCRL
jgi:hypothetical protein